MQDAFEFRLEILKNELDTINESIRKIDDIGNSIKNWAIVTWTGSLAVVLGNKDLHTFLVFTGLPPILFMFVDIHWRRIQRRFAYRQGVVSDYLNSSKFDVAFKDRKLDFRVLDPISRGSSGREDFKKFISIGKLIRFPTISLVYLGLFAFSVVGGIYFYL